MADKEQALPAAAVSQDPRVSARLRLIGAMFDLAEDPESEPELAQLRAVYDSLQRPSLRLIQGGADAD